MNSMNRTEKQLERIAKLLGEQTTLSLATTGEDGQPCIAPLFYIADEQLSLYWLSSPHSLHSRNLIRTPHAAVTVYCAAQSWREIRGVQMRGSVSILNEPQRRSAIITSYCQRFNLGRVLRLAVNQSVLHIFDRSSFAPSTIPEGSSPNLNSHSCQRVGRRPARLSELRRTIHRLSNRSLILAPLCGFYRHLLANSSYPRASWLINDTEEILWKSGAE